MEVATGLDHPTGHGEVATRPKHRTGHGVERQTRQEHQPGHGEEVAPHAEQLPGNVVEWASEHWLGDHEGQGDGRRRQLWRDE